MNPLKLIFDILRHFNVGNDTGAIINLQRRAEDWYEKQKQSDVSWIKWLIHTVCEGWLTQTFLLCYSIKLKRDVAIYISKSEDVDDFEDEDEDFDDEDEEDED